MSDTTVAVLDGADHRFLGWPLGWALAAAALVATGGTAGWTQSPSWNAVLGIALGAAGMSAGAWWSCGRREAVAYGAAFLLAAGILKLGIMGAGVPSFILAGGIVGLIGDSAQRPFDPRRSVRWGVGFAVGTLLTLYPGAYASHLAGALAERITGLQAADTIGIVLGAALAGGLCGALAALIGDPDG